MVRPLAFSRSLLFPLPWARFLEPMKRLAVMQSSRSGPTSRPTTSRTQMTRGRSFVMRSLRPFLVERRRLVSWRLESC
ncbi:hypothetical protein SLEP1_g47532 [Rubroshorea leprosula]|uniref:Secreted protein n=1 Tax=Rubroshorea leprosula TaxID=152421 RepID=A0AAV5LTH5_9ROSI|nr:hypothetical protein SLEP1_g47532 [Rubroshorea leprosula]